MTRDYSEFPGDENGDVLWRMRQAGDNLAKPREIDFSVIFPTEQTALEFAVYLLRQNQKVSFAEIENNDEMPWQVQAHPVMVPSHESITQYENQLAEDAAEFSGLTDGWGAMQQE